MKIHAYNAWLLSLPFLALVAGLSGMRKSVVKRMSDMTGYTRKRKVWQALRRLFAKGAALFVPCVNSPVNEGEMNVPLFRYLARRLARTAFGQKALSRPDGRLSLLQRKPGTRVYIGLALITSSCLACLPALAFLSYLSVKVSKPIMLVVGGPVIFIVAHMIFGAGVFLAGQNFAMEMLLWTTKRFLRRFA